MPGYCSARRGRRRGSQPIGPAPLGEIGGTDASVGHEAVPGRAKRTAPRAAATRSGDAFAAGVGNRSLMSRCRHGTTAVEFGGAAHSTGAHELVALIAHAMAWAAAARPARGDPECRATLRFCRRRREV